VARERSDTFAYQLAIIAPIEDDELVRHTHAGDDRPAFSRPPLGTGVADQIALSGRPFLVTDGRDAPDNRASGAVPDRYGVISRPSCARNERMNPVRARASAAPAAVCIVSASPSSLR